MRLPPRTMLGAALTLLGLLALLVGAVGALSVPSLVAAAPLADLPTVTPAPPTPEPSVTPASSATPEPTLTAVPTNTPVPEPTDEPQRRPSPTATPTLIPSPMPSPTASPSPGPATDLRIEKLADVQTVAPGGTVVFTIRISTSTGSTGMADVVMRDLVPEPLEVVDLASDRGDIIVQGREVTAFPATLAPGEVVTIRITARVPTNAAAGTIVNTATVTSSTPGDPPGNNTSSVPVRITAVYTPQSLPVTADPNEPTLLMQFLPWFFVGALLLALGAMLLLYRRRLPLLRVPARGLAVEATAASARSHAPRRSPAPPVPAAPADMGLLPRLGPALPPARAPEALPPRPGTYQGANEGGDGELA